MGVQKVLNFADPEKLCKREYPKQYPTDSDRFEACFRLMGWFFSPWVIRAVTLFELSRWQHGRRSGDHGI
jgi:hypothetical protein